MPQLDTFISPGDQPPNFQQRLATEKLRSLLTYCEAGAGDERLYRYHECQERLHELQSASGTRVVYPKGKPRPEPETTEKDETDE